MNIIYKMRVEISEKEMTYLKATDWNVEKNRLNNFNECTNDLIQKGVIYEVSDRDGCETIYYLTGFGKQLLQCTEFVVN